MKGNTLYAALLALADTGLASALPPSLASYYDSRLERRAFAADPSGYQPVTTACPSNRPALRDATGLSQAESSWLQQRRPQALDAMSQFLQRVSIPNFDAAQYFSSNQNNASSLPNVAIAASGGGYRALMNGAGAVAAFDSRTPNSTADGQLGGILQSATYLAGLSGGSWLVGSIYANNFSTVTNFINSDGANGLWDFQNSIFEGPDTGSIGVFDTVGYFHDVLNQVSSKDERNFNISITDYWGRALSYQLINAQDGGPGYTFSSIAQQEFFTNGSVPFPMFVSDSRLPNQVAIPENTTIFELNPFEIGSWDPTVFGFAPMQYVGSNFSAGTLAQNESCVVGFDNLGFAFGTSSTLFNEGLLIANESGLPDFFRNALTSLLSTDGINDNVVATWQPNPFLGFNPDSNPFTDAEALTLTDGGEDNQNIPFNPVIQPFRAVDVVFAIDSSADTNMNWPNGSSLVQTYDRTFNNTQQNGTAFPYIPTVETFINLGLNNRPVFFGCNASNTTNAPTSPDQPPSPIIVYLPNAPYAFQSNQSTFTPSTDVAERDAIITNGYDVATQGNGTLDSNWPVCVACAMLQRSMARTNTQFPQACTQCFNQYCWDGTVNNTAPGPYEPNFKLSSQQLIDSGFQNDARRSSPSLIAAAGVLASMAWCLV